MKKFFKNNLILIIASGVVVVSMILSSFLPAITFLSCILAGVYCIYVSYLLFKKYLNSKNSKIDEFLNEEEQKTRKRTTFLEGETRSNLILLFVLFVFVGIMLIYYGIMSIL